jgi:hypothetical protein
MPPPRDATASFEATTGSVASATNPLTSFGIWVAVRVRPFNKFELGGSDVEAPQPVVEMERDRKTLTLLDPSNNYRERSTFSFDFCFSPFLPAIVLEDTDRTVKKGDSDDDDDSGGAERAQAEIYNAVGCPIVSSAWQGYNSCIFAYGQTSSGKSYTMMGTKRDPGIIPRLCRELFERVERETRASDAEGSRKMVKISLSYMEIYNEQVKDLLKARSKDGKRQFKTRFDTAGEEEGYQQLRVRQHPLHGPFVEGLSKVDVASWIDCIQYIRQGNERRSQCSTSMNESSSRSHAIFQLVVTQTEALGAKVRGKEVVNHKVSKINLVDLAGSERITRTNVTGKHITEANHINVSLSTLRKVIDALVSKKRPGQPLVVPYRESLLTWILADNFGGNSKTAMIANISPHHANFLENESTLRYATLAKGIVNRVRVNEDPSAKLIRELQSQLKQLQLELGKGATEGHVRDLEDQMEENKKAMEELLAREEGMRVLIQESREREEQLRVEKETLVKDQQRWRTEAEHLRREKEELKAQLQRLAIGGGGRSPTDAGSSDPAFAPSAPPPAAATKKPTKADKSDFWANQNDEADNPNDDTSCPPNQNQIIRRRRSTKSLHAQETEPPFLSDSARTKRSDAAEDPPPPPEQPHKPSSAETTTTKTPNATGIVPRKRAERAPPPWVVEDSLPTPDPRKDPAPAQAGEDKSSAVATPDVRHGRRAATEQGERPAQPSSDNGEPTVRTAGAGRRRQELPSTAVSPVPGAVPPSLAHLVGPSGEPPKKQQAQPDALDSFLTGGVVPTQRERGKPWKPARRTPSQAATPM